MKKVWTTREGGEIEISKMSESHLDNAIRFIEKKAKEGIIVGDVGNWGDEPWADEVFGEEAIEVWQPQYDWLKEEKRKRHQPINNT